MPEGIRQKGGAYERQWKSFLFQLYFDHIGRDNRVDDSWEDRQFVS